MADVNTAWPAVRRGHTRGTPIQRAAFRYVRWAADGSIGSAKKADETRKRKRSLGSKLRSARTQNFGTKSAA